MRRLCATLIGIATTLWCLAILAAPHARAVAPVAEHPSLARAVAIVYLTGSFICHQRPERSFHAAGVAYPVCSRCTGLYLGTPLGLLIALLMGKPQAPGEADVYRRWRLVILLTMVPTVISLGLEWAGGPSDTMSRAIAALPLGAASAALAGAAVLGHFTRDAARPPAGV